jgi:predicted TIM-barrel fold metal-dependent hydrolase
MRFCGIGRALVYHSGMRFEAPDTWNDRLAEEIRPYPDLHPLRAILPTQTGEMPEPERLFAEMKRCGARALISFPHEHSYSLDALTFGPLFGAMIERKIPLFVKADLGTIGGLLKEFPRLTVIAMNQGPHSVERFLRPMMDGYPSLHIETSYYIIDGAIEGLFQRYGPRRMLFGSAFPDNSSGASLLRLALADIPEQARALIAAGNLEKLLGEATP